MVSWLQTPPVVPQGCGGQEESGSEDRRSADEAGGAGDRPRGEQADRPGHFQAQLPGPPHLGGMVRALNPRETPRSSDRRAV